MNSAAVPDTDPMIGLTLAGRYTLTSRVGQGSMGAVYRALQIAVGRDVAVKILHDDRAGDAAANARFLREARADSLLVSPHTVQVLDFGQGEEGELFLVMELLEGESLRKRLSRLGRLPIAGAIDTCRQTLRSLAEAHAKGVVHRDLKPDHLFFARVKGSAPEDEILKVIDFGVAKMLGNEARQFNVVETREGHVLGTPRYMSPEQAEGKPVDHRSDLYSLGVILYEMLTGRPPFVGANPVLVMAQHIARAPVRPSVTCPEANIPAALDDLVMRALAKQPAARPADAEAMADALAALLDGADATGVRRAARRVSAARPEDASARAPLTSLDAITTPQRVLASDGAMTRVIGVRRPALGWRGLVLAALGLGAMVGLGVMLGRIGRAAPPSVPGVPSEAALANPAPPLVVPVASAEVPSLAASAAEAPPESIAPSPPAVVMGEPSAAPSVAPAPTGSPAPAMHKPSRSAPRVGRRGTGKYDYLE